MKLIDTHAHISYRDYSDTVDNIINSAIDNGVEKIISVGTDLNSSEECVELAEKYPCVYATCGYHPHEAKNTPKRYLYELEQISSHPKVVAIGEIGLDYHYNFSDPKVQNKVYREQLEMSKALSLPTVIHCRKSDEEILIGLREVEHSSGVIHCFASNLEFAKQILSIGYYISFTGLITFVKELEEVVRLVPLEKIMLETDSPYLAPIPHRGKQNEPSNVLYVANKIAEIKETSVEKIAETTTVTAHMVFSKLSNNI